MVGITYLFIYWSIPKFLFKRKYLLFGLISTAVFLVILNLQILFIKFNHLFISDYLNEMVELVHWEFFYLIIANTIFPLSFIVYESIRFWNKTRSEVEELAEYIDQPNYIEIKSNGKKQLIDSNTIIYIESFKDHAHIHLTDQKIVSRMTLKKINKLLPEFLRTHRSYIVNPKFCQAFNTDEVILGEKKVPIGGTYKDEVSDALQSNIQSRY